MLATRVTHETKRTRVKIDGSCTATDEYLTHRLSPGVEAFSVQCGLTIVKTVGPLLTRIRSLTDRRTSVLEFDVQTATKLLVTWCAVNQVHDKT